MSKLFLLCRILIKEKFGESGSMSYKLNNDAIQKFLDKNNLTWAEFLQKNRISEHLLSNLKDGLSQMLVSSLLTLSNALNISLNELIICEKDGDFEFLDNKEFLDTGMIILY